MDMAINDLGNMSEVYRAALENAATVERRNGPFAAELVPESPCWHLLKTAPSREATAAAHLIGRRFGTYLPTFGRDDVLPISGAVRAGKPLFPGYLFIFVWSVELHWRRILGCPGVAQIVTVDERPVIVPDKVIDEIQVLEVLNGNRDALTVTVDDVCRAGRRGWRKRRRDVKPPKPEPVRDLVTISTRSAFTDLDDDGRISALHAALGLASNAPV